MRLFVHILLALVIVGCAPIEKQQTLVAGSASVVTVGVGDVVAKIQKTRDLKNAFGAADIWGRTTSEGYSEVRFAGVEPDGTIVLFRRDLVIETDEDVFTRSGMGVVSTNTYGSASVTGNTVTGSANSTTIYTQPRQATTIVVPSGTFPIRIPPGTTNVPFDTVTIQVISADAVSLTYRIIN